MVLHKFSDIAPGGRITNVELFWTKWEETISCHLEVVRDWDKSASSEEGHCGEVEARSPCICRGSFKRMCFNSNTRDSLDSSHLMYGVHFTSVVANMTVLNNIHILPETSFYTLFFFFSKPHQPASGQQDSNAVSAEKRSGGITVEISFLDCAHRCN